MTFLDKLWEKEQRQKSNTDDEKENKRNDDSVQKPKASTAIYTIIAEDDCVLWRWSFEDMEKLMSSSTDMRGALTRAMTNAVVGKVVNMTVSRAKVPQWTAWLGDWTREDGAQVELKRIQTMPEENEQVSNSTPQVI
mmetsp:Transcript_13368/g.24007  ORF Transcript_13368/g.24007 Transcript_13368/m.24007 type:complete len:137 (+) Transcript_13368:3-413(+)